MKNTIFSILILLLSAVVGAQEVAPETIEEVVIYANFSPKYQVGYTIEIFSDSILKKENISLKKLLQKYSNIYIKEYGNAMLASIAMRGSSASHTGVYWNGISINSALNGQVDFNIVSPSLFNKISVRKGGGSVLLGTGAVGGAINLENKFYFNNKTKGNVLASYGSYNNYALSANVAHSTSRLSFQISGSGRDFKNNYPYLETEEQNKNAEIKNVSFQAGLAFKPKAKHQIYLQSLNIISDKNLSGTLHTTSKMKLLYQTKSVVSGWKYSTNLYQTHLKSVYLDERYKFWMNHELPNNFSNNSTKKWIESADFNYIFKPDLKLFSGISYEVLKGKGSDISSLKQNKLALFTWLHHRLTDKLNYNVSLRKEWASNYTIPLVFSLDAKMNWTAQHTTKFNVSSNFKTPTLNDLYWKPGGNPDLKPEKNWTLELSYIWQPTDALVFNVNSYTTNSVDLIQWRPFTSSYWKPINIQEVNAYGLEYGLKFFRTLDESQITLTTQGSYTVSEDLKTKKQLLYVPQEVCNATAEYAYKNWNLSYATSYTGKAFTTSSNTQYIPAFWVSDVSFSKAVLKQRLHINFAVNNLFNQKYEVVASRPMPNRNYSLSVRYKF